MPAFAGMTKQGRLLPMSKIFRFGSVGAPAADPIGSSPREGNFKTDRI